MKNSIIFIYPNLSSFVKLDLDIVSTKYNVLPFEFKSQKGIGMIFKQGQLFFWLLRNMFKCKAIYIWFADYHGLLPVCFAKIFGKKVIVAVGGFDAARIIEYNYGAHTKFFRSSISKFVLNNSHCLLPSSKSVAQHLYLNVGKHLEKKIQICYLGYSPNIESTTSLKRAIDLICISASDSFDRLKIKGVDRFVHLAEIAPNLNCTLVGLTGKAFEWVNERKPQNLTVFGLLNDAEINSLLCKSKIITQLSRYEAFGMVLLEGMYQGCYPVTSINIGAAEVISENIGMSLDTDNMDDVKIKIENIINSKIEHDTIAQYSKNRFSIETRMNIILNCIE